MEVIMFRVLQSELSALYGLTANPWQTPLQISCRMEIEKHFVFKTVTQILPMCVFPCNSSLTQESMLGRPGYTSKPVTEMKESKYM